MKQMPSDDVPRQMLVLQLELLRSNELVNEMEIVGAWTGVVVSLQNRAGVCATAVELGVLNLAAERLREIPSPADMVAISRGKTELCSSIFWTVHQILKAYSGCVERPDLTACVTLGIFDMSVEAAIAVASAGKAGLHDVHTLVLYNALEILMKCSAQPGCEVKIRSAAGALAFCLEHDLEIARELGLTTGAVTARLCCNVFGRDEDSEFIFTPQHIEMLTEFWTLIVTRAGYLSRLKPTQDEIYAAQLCVSDVHKPLLMANRRFVPYLVDALLLDPDHPRADMDDEAKAWCQHHHCEALAQLAMHEESRQALLLDGSVVPALEMAVKVGLNEETRELAAAALSALNGKELQMSTEGQKHVMLSCESAVDTLMCCIRI